MNNELPKIHCTTTVTIRNTKTGYIYKDEIEKESDIKFSALARKIFDSELSLDKKMHLRYFVEKIDRICDQAEDIADEIQIYAIKRSI